MISPLFGTASAKPEPQKEDDIEFGVDDESDKIDDKFLDEPPKSEEASKEQVDILEIQ